MIRFSKWKVFGIAYLGFVLPGALAGIYQQLTTDQTNAYIKFGPLEAVIGSVVLASVYAALVLPLPLLLSFAVNRDLGGTVGSMWFRALLLGFGMLCLFAFWMQEEWPVSRSWQFVKTFFGFLSLFIFPVFVLAHRAGSNPLRGDGLHNHAAQQRAPADSQEPRS